MPRSAFIAILLFLPGLVFQAAAAQTCDVTVPATVVDAKTGVFITDVPPALLHARIRNQFFPVTSVERIKTFRVLLLVDSSGSMEFESVLLSHKIRTVKEIRNILERELLSAPRGVQLGFGIFNDKTAFSHEFTSDPQRFQSLIADTTARLKKPGYGETALLDALRDSLSQFGSPHPGDTVLVITDGGENKSKVPEKEIARQFAESGIRIFVILISTSEGSSNPEEMAGPGLMSELAERTGGAVHKVDAKNTFWGDRKWSAMANEDLNLFWKEQVLSAYWLHLTIPARSKKEEKWILAVDPAANGKEKMAAGYPSRLQPCGVNTALR